MGISMDNPIMRVGWGVSISQAVAHVSSRTKSLWWCSRAVSPFANFAFTRSYNHETAETQKRRNRGPNMVLILCGDGSRAENNWILFVLHLPPVLLFLCFVGCRGGKRFHTSVLRGSVSRGWQKASPILLKRSHWSIDGTLAAWRKVKPGWARVPWMFLWYYLALFLFINRLINE